LNPARVQSQREDEFMSRRSAAPKSGRKAAAGARRPDASPTRKHRTPSTAAPEEADTRAAGEVPTPPEQDPGRVDIERLAEQHGVSIETASRDEGAGGVEAPGPLAEDEKFSPFE
jgi:hypothetical protein